MVAREVLLLRAHRHRRAPKHKGITVLIIDMDTPGIDVRPIKHITGAEDFAEVFFTDVEVPVDNVVGPARTTAGASRWVRSRTSAVRLWVQWVAMVQQPCDDLCSMARRHGLDRDAGVRRRLAEAYEQVASLRALGYKGFASFAQGSLRARAQLLEAGDVRARQDAVRARDATAGTVRRGESIPNVATERGRWARVVLRQLRQHDGRRIERDPAQHHRHPCARTAAE